MAFFSGKTAGVLIAIGLGLASQAIAAPPDRNGTLSRIKRNGYVSCGISGELLGFSFKDKQGAWQGFDIDYCRALAAAIFNDPAKIRIREINLGSRVEELEKRRVDVVVARASASMTREIGEGFTIPVITYFDGQGLLVAKKLEITSVQELAGKTICVQKATTKADNVVDFFGMRKIFVKLISYSSGFETFEGYERGECDAVSADMATLYAWRAMSDHAENYTFLPDIVTKEPTGPVVLGRDRNWSDIIRWVHMAMVNAEELKVNQRNVEEERASPDLTIRRLLGVEDHLGQELGLDDEWAYRVIRSVGNYGEIFERNLGNASPLKIKRGQNALWSEGGLQYGIPIR